MISNLRSLSITGYICLFIVILVNEYTLTFLFSEDGSIESPAYQYSILFIDFLLITLGIVFVLHKFFKQWIVKICLLLFTIILIVGVMELLFWVAMKNKFEAEIYNSQSFVKPDDLLGYTGIPLNKILSVKTLGDDTIFDVKYNFDPYGRRISTQEYDLEINFAIFFGCSQVFGTGLNDEETLPWQFGKQQHRFIVYNYGFPGYGPQQMLAKLESGELKNEIKNENGVFIYLFADDHVQRAIGSMTVHYGWGENMPNYQLSNNQDGVTRIGNFTNSRPIRSFIYKLAGISNFVKFFNINWPPMIQKEDIRLTTEIINQSAKRATTLFRSSKFFLIFKPGSRYKEAILQDLDTTAIKVIDFSSLYNHKNIEYYIPEDGHSSAKANKSIALELNREITSYYLP